MLEIDCKKSEGEKRIVTFTRKMSKRRKFCERKRGGNDGDREVAFMEG